jgi:dTDP-4-dehydrorhamnose reductase
MNITVIGADGQLGSDICEVFENNHHTVKKLTISDIDISLNESVEKVLSNHTCTDFIINTAAFHHVEKCEQEIQRAFEVNAIGSLNLAKTCNKINIPLVHISTDYIFDGEKKKPYLENDAPMPLNVYANSKLSGEYFIRSTMERYFIVRVSGIYGKNMCLAKGYNFVDKMLQLAKEREFLRVVDDEILTPTPTEAIARQLETLLSAPGKFGIYHMTAEGQCSWYEFAKEIFSIAKIPIDVQKALPGEFKVKVNRPLYSVLENKFLKEQGLNIMPPWQEGLKNYLLKNHLK